MGAGTENPLATQAVDGNPRCNCDLRRKTNQCPLQLDVRWTYREMPKTFLMKRFRISFPPFASTNIRNRYPFLHRGRFRTGRTRVLTVAGVSNYTEARRFLGLSGQGEPQSSDPAASGDIHSRVLLSRLCRRLPILHSLLEQGILPASGTLPRRTKLLFRLIDKKGAFEWQQGVLISWDPAPEYASCWSMVSRRNSSSVPTHRFISAIGDERLAMREGAGLAVS